MEKLTIEMPLVSQCSAVKCTYNVNQRCHAKAITVGDADNPRCDTFFSNRSHSRDTQRIAGVGACKVAVCVHNSDFECVAENIAVDQMGKGIYCTTFNQR